MINLCWFWFKWGLILCVIGAALAVPYFYHRMDEEIRRRVESRLAQQYPGLEIKIRSAVLVKGEGIEVRGLTIVDPAAEGPGAELLKFDECIFRCSTDLDELLTGEPEVLRVVLRRPTLRMTRRLDGTWSAARLLPLPKMSNHPPEVTIENGTIEIFDPAKAPSTMLTLRDVNLTLVPPAETSGTVGGTPHSRKLQGTLTGDYFRQVSFEGEVDPHRPAFAITGSVEGMEICPELRDALPGLPPSNLSVLSALRGQGELTFQVRYDSSSASPWQFAITGRLTRGRIDDPRLPYPLTDVRAQLRVNNEGFQIGDLSARCNQATLRGRCQSAGLGPACPLVLEGEVQQFDVDRRFVEALPEALQEQWHKYRPEGQIDAEVKLSYDGRQWRPELRIRCLNVSFTHHKFPYRLEHGRGTLFLQDDVLRLSIMAYSGNQMVRIDGELHDPGQRATGWVEAKGEEIPIDQKLLLALPERPRNLARSLDLRGALGFEYRFGRKTPEEVFHQRLTMRISRCLIKYEHFPYPLANIRGTLEMLDGNWVFRNLEGANGTAHITGDGTLTATPDGPELLLRFQAGEVPLEDELRDAMRPAMRQVWNMLRPRGTVDLTADLRYAERTNKLDLSVRAQPRSESSSIEPVAFPYRLEKLQGILTYSGGRVTIERFKAEHGTMKVAAGGFCGFLPDGGWHLHLDGLTVDRLRVDRELMQAVPARLKKACVELNPTGPLNLRGTFDLARAGVPGDPIRSQWDLAVGLQQVGLDCGVRLENIHGNLSVRGGFDGRNFHSRGELALDSLTYKDCQFTQIMGPLWVDDQQVLLGSWVDRLQKPPLTREAQDATKPRPITAKLFGGTLYGDGWVALGSRPRYGIQATLVDAELAQCAQEAMAGKQNLRGRILGSVELRGSGRSQNDLAGHGNIQLRSANIYELPQMIAMLKILSVRAPDPNAFSKSDIDFRIEGQHIYFDKLDFSGDAISLLGKGEMNFQRDIRLTFTAMMGRGELGMPALKKIFTGASQQFILVHVGGSLQNPDIRKEAFPGVNQALQQLQEGREVR